MPTLPPGKVTMKELRRMSKEMGLRSYHCALKAAKNDPELWKRAIQFALKETKIKTVLERHVELAKGNQPLTEELPPRKGSCPSKFEKMMRALAKDEGLRTSKGALTLAEEDIELWKVALVCALKENMKTIMDRHVAQAKRDEALNTCKKSKTQFEEKAKPDTPMMAYPMTRKRKMELAMNKSEV